MTKSGIGVDTENITIRVNRRTGSNADIDDIVTRKLETMTSPGGRQIKSDAAAALIRDGAAAAALLGVGGELVAAVEGLKKLRRCDRTIARQALDGIIGALRRGDYQLAEEMGHLARFQYFAEQNDGE